EGGWWYYFLYAYLVKTPIGTLLILAAAAVVAFRGRRVAAEHGIFLGLPILVFVLITCLWRVNIGLRPLPPIHPFLYISARRLLARREKPAPAPWMHVPAGVAALCLAWNAVQAVRILPYDLAYFT